MKDKEAEHSKVTESHTDSSTEDQNGKTTATKIEYIRAIIYEKLIDPLLEKAGLVIVDEQVHPSKTVRIIIAEKRKTE